MYERTTATLTLALFVFIQESLEKLLLNLKFLFCSHLNYVCNRMQIFFPNVLTSGKKVIASIWSPLVEKTQRRYFWWFLTFILYYVKWNYNTCTQCTIICVSCLRIICLMVRMISIRIVHGANDITIKSCNVIHVFPHTLFECSYLYYTLFLYRLKMT